MTLIDGLSYEYEYTPDEGIPGCPICDGALDFVNDTPFSQPRYLVCEDCEIVCDYNTEKVYFVGSAKSSGHDLWLQRSELTSV